MGLPRYQCQPYRQAITVAHPSIDEWALKIGTFSLAQYPAGCFPS
jgi:hypothetical protein